MLTHQRQLEALKQHIKKLQDEKFWGTVHLRFREGDLVLTTIEKTIPTELLEEQLVIEENK